MSQEEAQRVQAIQVDTRVVLAYQGRIAELESQLATQAADIKTLEKNYHGLASALTSIAKLCGKEWDSGYEEAIVVKLVAIQAQALKEAEEKFYQAEEARRFTREVLDDLGKGVALAIRYEGPESGDSLIDIVREVRVERDSLRSQLEAAKEDRDSAESKAASYEAMEPYATVKLLQGQLEAANRDLSRRWQQLEESSMAIEDTLHAQLSAIASAIYPEKESGFTYSVAFMVQEILELRRDRDIANRGRTAILAMKDRADELRGFAEVKLENVTAELETAEQEIREWEESLKINQRDYEDMRRFQGKFIEADQERRTLKGQLETAQLERDRDEVTITAQAWQPEMGSGSIDVDAETGTADDRIGGATVEAIKRYLNKSTPPATCSECGRLQNVINDMLRCTGRNAANTDDPIEVIKVAYRELVQLRMDTKHQVESLAERQEECGRLRAALERAGKELRAVQHIRQKTTLLGRLERAEGSRIPEGTTKWFDEIANDASKAAGVIDAALASKPTPGEHT